MTDGERLEEIVETAVARGDAPGVVAADTWPAGPVRTARSS